MGLKYYRGSDKPKRIRKRFTQTRTWIRQFSWVCYHAHPEMVPGHGFKGGVHMSTGYLQNPEIKRFQINTPIAFFPPNPTKTAGFVAAAAAVPSFGNFFSAYFGGETRYNMGNPASGKMLENLKRCYETNQDNNPEEACAYYIDGFKRLAC